MHIRIEAPHFVAGITINSEGNQVAPIIFYMKWWNPSRILDYCDKKGWKYQIS